MGGCDVFAGESDNFAGDVGSNSSFAGAAVRANSNLEAGSIFTAVGSDRSVVTTAGSSRSLVGDGAIAVGSSRSLAAIACDMPVQLVVLLPPVLSAA